MTFFKSLAVAISTYSIIPMPNLEWNEKNMKYAICFFPVVGIFCGVLMLALLHTANALNASPFFVAALATCIPLLVTGGIHMDGFMDTADAIASHQPRDKKPEILSDPHVGAFAVIYCVIYLALNMAFVYEIYSAGNLPALCPVYVLSRCVSALCAVNLPNAKKSGMLLSFTEEAKRKTVNIVMVLLVLALGTVMLVMWKRIAFVALVLGFLWTALYCKTVKKQFGGVTGDTAGFFLQMFELGCTIGIYIGEML